MKTWKNIALSHFAPHILLLFLVLLLVLNASLILVIHSAIAYPFQTPDRIIGEYPEYQVLTSRNNGQIYGAVLKLDNQTFRLVLTEKHFFLNRWHSVCDIPLTQVNYSGEFSGSNGKIIVKLHGYSEFSHFNWIPNPLTLPLGNFFVPLSFLLWNVAALLLELILWFLIRKLQGK